MVNRAARARWDEEYLGGRYDGEPPIPFAGEIITKVGELIPSGKGLYVGCGNGRNFIPMAEAGLDLYGIDISGVGISKLGERRPELRDRLEVSDLLDGIHDDQEFDYVVSLQVFQHGVFSEAKRYFTETARILSPGGLLFLRVNSASTEPRYAHAGFREKEMEGFTIRYTEGPKQGMSLHFYSENELLNLAQVNGFETIEPLREVTMRREDPAHGTWTQWETIWQKTLN